MEYLALKAGQLWQAHTGHVFRGVQWDDVNNIKIMSRNSSHLSLANPNFCLGSWTVAEHSHFPKNFPTPGSVPQRQSLKVS